MKSTIKYKIVKGRKRPLCDYHGTCKNLAYKEVYLFLLKEKYKDTGRSYLCKEHFKQENKKFRGKLPCSSI